MRGRLPPMAPTSHRAPFAGGKLQASRLDAGLTPTQLAHKAGTQRQRIHEWERGDTTPHPHQLADLAAALDIRPDHLVDTTTLRGRRYAAGLTQAEAAQRAGINAAEWSRWESGLAIPPRHQAAVLKALRREGDDTRRGTP